MYNFPTGSPKTVCNYRRVRVIRDDDNNNNTAHKLSHSENNILISHAELYYPAMILVNRNTSNVCACVCVCLRVGIVYSPMYTQITLFFFFVASCEEADDADYISGEHRRRRVSDVQTHAARKGEETIPDVWSESATVIATATTTTATAITSVYNTVLLLQYSTFNTIGNRPCTLYV